jgi:hypothetical protein
MSRPRPARHRGAFRDRHKRWCGMRWTQVVLKTRALSPPSLKLRRTGTKPVEAFGVDGCGRPSRVVLTPRRRRQVRGTQFSRTTVTRKPDRREEHEATVKTIAWGRRVKTGEPVVTMLVCLFFIAREAAGAAGIRRSPRPPLGGRFMQASGASRRENAESRPERSGCLKLESAQCSPSSRPSEARAGTHNHRCRRYLGMEPNPSSQLASVVMGPCEPGCMRSDRVGVAEDRFFDSRA